MSLFCAIINNIALCWFFFRPNGDDEIFILNFIIFRCSYCDKAVVPFLYITVLDYRNSSEMTQFTSEESMSSLDRIRRKSSTNKLHVCPNSVGTYLSPHLFKRNWWTLFFFLCSFGKLKIYLCLFVINLLILLGSSLAAEFFFFDYLTSVTCEYFRKCITLWKFYLFLIQI